VAGASHQQIQLESYQRAYEWRNAVSSEKGMTKNEYFIIEQHHNGIHYKYLVVKATSKASGTPRVVKFITDYKYRTLVDKTTWTPKFNRGKIYITSRERTPEVPNGKITHFAKALLIEEGLKPESFDQKFRNGEPRDLRFQNLCITGEPREKPCRCWDPLHTLAKEPFDSHSRFIAPQDPCAQQTLKEFDWIIEQSDQVQ
jgi:hypothetical protein